MKSRYQQPKIFAAIPNRPKTNAVLCHPRPQTPPVAAAESIIREWNNRNNGHFQANSSGTFARNDVDMDFGVSTSLTLDDDNDDYQNPNVTPLSGEFSNGHIMRGRCKVVVGYNKDCTLLNEVAPTRNFKHRFTIERMDKDVRVTYESLEEEAIYQHWVNTDPLYNIDYAPATCRGRYLANNTLPGKSTKQEIILVQFADSQQGTEFSHFYNYAKHLLESDEE